MDDVKPTVIDAIDAIRYAIALREMMAAAGIEKFVKPHPVRDLLDALTKPSEDALKRIENA
jgi:hypothetical protein